MTNRSRSFVLVAVAALAWSSFAHAKSSYPQQIQRQLGLSYAVPCGVCHLKGNTGPGTAGTPFALSLRARGLSGQGRSSVTTAVAALEADHVDTDGDGTPDIDELHAGTDPNSSANASLIGEPDPGYGCGGSPPRGNGGAAPPLAAVSALAWLLRRLRRGRA